jgi:hypothetical protein
MELSLKKEMKLMVERSHQTQNGWCGGDAKPIGKTPKKNC